MVTRSWLEEIDAADRELLAVARRHALTPQILKGKLNVRARWEAYHRVREATQWSYTDLGRYFGRNHSTIIHGVRKHLRRLHGSDCC